MRRRAIILPLALLIIGLLAVLAARVVFRSNADIAAVQAAEAGLQARLAAQAGIQKALSVLQGSTNSESALNGPTGMDVWYNNPDAFRAIVVRSPDDNTTGVGSSPSTVPSSQNPAIWRFSVVANDPLVQNGDAAIRYGLTDESSKLNMNVASRQQLATLIRLIVHDMSVDPDDLAKAIWYYRSKAAADQAEDSYYQALDPPYLPPHAALPVRRRAAAWCAG